MKGEQPEPSEVQEIKESAETAPDRERALEERAEEAAEKAGELKGVLDREPGAFAEETAGELIRLEEGGFELADGPDQDPEAVAAKADLDELDEAVSAAAGQARSRAARLLAKAKRWGRALLGVGAVAGAIGTLEGCATQPMEGKKVAAAAGKIETGGEHRKAPELVHSETLEGLKKNAELRAVLGQENLDQLIEGFEKFDEGKSIEAYAELAGLDPELLRDQTFKSIDFLTDKQIGEGDAELQDLIILNRRAVTTNDRLTIRIENPDFLDESGKIDPEKILETILHEQGHVLSTREKLSGEERRFWDGKISHRLYEGVTELLSQKVKERLGHAKPKDQAYEGGDFAAAFIIDKLVGTEALAADYFEGTTQRIEAALESRLGPAGPVENRRRIVKRSLKQEGLNLVHTLLSATQEAGRDPNEFAEAMVKEGVKERLHWNSETGTAALTKEKGGTLSIVGVVFKDEASVKLSPNSEPLSVISATYIRDDSSGPKANLRAEEIHRRVQDLEQQFRPGGPGTPAELAQFQRYMQELYDDQAHTYDLTLRVNVYHELAPLKDKYSKATSAEEKRQIERQMIELAEQRGRHNLAAIKNELAKHTGALK